MNSSTAICYKTRRDVLCSHLPDDEAVLLDLDASTYFGLNAVGAFNWRLLENPQRLSDLVSATMEEFEIDLATCEADLQELLQQLAENKLVETVQA